MVLKKLAARIKKVRASFEKAKAKAYGMTVPELRRHLAKRKAEKRAYKEELRRIEAREKAKFEKWKIKQKYKRKRKLFKAGKAGRGALAEFTGAMEMLGGKPQKGGPDPFGIFGTPSKPRRKRRKTARKKKRKKRRKKR
jgi:hypothetical protein